MKTEELFVVFKPTFESEESDIFSGQATTLQSLYNQFIGGLKPDMIHGVYTKIREAEKEADMLYKALLSTRNENDPFTFPMKERFKMFVHALEEISTKYGVAVYSTGGVKILNNKQDIVYSDDHTSGDIQPIN
jgi:hypothetical protein